MPSFSPCPTLVPSIYRALDMSKPGSVDIDASQSRGRKRSHTEEDSREPSTKRSKLTPNATVHTPNGNKRREENQEPRREMTPEEIAHEKAIKERSKKYQRGAAAKPNLRNIKDKRLKGVMARHEEKFKQAADKAARAEILHTEQAGFMEAENGLEATWKVKQSDIAREADLLTNSKMFSLALTEKGSYSFEYSKNGRYLLLASEKGHVALVDWHKNKLLCELELGENVRHACFLHNETMFAVAQKKNVYIYDKTGTELHRLRNHRMPNKVIFLPYHFLLCSIGSEGILRYQDTSTGELIAELKSKLGQCTTIAQNPRNAIVCLGHNNGSVTMWAPLNQEPLVKMICHRGAVTSIVIDHMGKIMITSGEDGCMKVWSLKDYQLLQSYYVKRPISQLCLSQTGLLALSFGCHVQVWKNFAHEQAKEPYMLYMLPNGGTIKTLAFCPFEDVLGIGHDQGFSSILVPGSGEAHIDTYAANPYETKKQRREATVHKLLDKIQPAMIVLDPDTIGSITKTTNKQEYQKDVEAALKAQATKKGTAQEEDDSNIIGPRTTGPKTKRVSLVDKKRMEMQIADREKLAEARKAKKAREAEFEAMDAQEDENFASRSALDRFKSK